MRRALAVLSFAALVTMAGSSAEASHGRPYSANVRQARQWLRERMDDRHFRCLDRLWHEESGWSVNTLGPATRWGRAMGLPQALPGSKMAAAERPRRGPAWDDWRTDALVQASWGLRYIRGRYNGACSAWRHFGRFQWY